MGCEVPQTIFGIKIQRVAIIFGFIDLVKQTLNNSNCKFFAKIYSTILTDFPHSADCYNHEQHNGYVGHHAWKKSESDKSVGRSR